MAVTVCQTLLDVALLPSLQLTLPMLTLAVLSLGVTMNTSSQVTYSSGHQVKPETQ